MVDCGAAIFDNSQSTYSYASRSLELMLGYPATTYLQGGLPFAFSLVHPDDLPGLIYILEKEAHLLDVLSAAERLEHRSSYDYRLRHADGHYIRVWQRNQILTLDQAGNLLRRLSLITDVSHLKRDDSQMLSLYQGRGTLVSYVYNTLERSFSACRFLSHRERDVLRLLSHGGGSQQIADTLNISVHTVETHRRNMLTKSNMRDTSSLIAFALAAGIL